ncbi:hypothetical protein [Kordiimonas aquimaris]|uniref:hypothetical protein n=1 Tax=Kordiimonas aquimaris TaxID=707591 RepID=UPI0021CE5073|nr:hypothetical protein [Kordiimonas aquimaris]
MKQKRINLTALIATASVFIGSTYASAQEAHENQSLQDMNFLVGEWILETSYANGNKANGTRSCAYTLRDTYIKCSTKSIFAGEAANGQARDLETYFNYNARTKQFEETTVFQLPVGRKVGDAYLDKSNGTMMIRGYIYGGDGSSGPRVSEEWAISEDEITMTMRLNRGTQAAHEWPVFITETMTKKK